MNTDDGDDVIKVAVTIETWHPCLGRNMQWLALACYCFSAHSVSSSNIFRE